MAAYPLCELVGAIGVPGGMNAAGMPNLAINPADGVVTSPLNYRSIPYSVTGDLPGHSLPGSGRLGRAYLSGVD